MALISLDSDAMLTMTVAQWEVKAKELHGNGWRYLADDIRRRLGFDRNMSFDDVWPVLEQWAREKGQIT